MSLFWKKAFGQYSLMLKSIATGLVRLCNCCPCIKWNIVTLCPCGDCNSTGPCFVGTDVVVGENQETGEYGPDGLVIDVKAITMVDHVPSDPNATGGVEGGGVNAWNCIRVSSGCILWAIKHSTNAAPFDCLTTGSVEIEVNINDTQVATWSGHVGNGLSIDIGDGVNGNQYGADILEIDPDADHTGYTFSTDGEYIVDLLVTFNPDNSQLEPVKYTCRTVVNVSEQPDTVDWIGQPFIVEDVTDFEGVCPWHGVDPTTLMNMRMYSTVLKGAFDTREDAEYVLTNFGGIIDAYAGTCVCDTSCEGDYFGPHHIGEQGPDGCYRVFEAGGETDGKDTASCEYGYLRYDVSSSGDFRFRLYDTRGNYTTITSGTGLIPPCWRLEMWFCGDPENPDGAISGDFWVVEGQPTCALSDPDSPYFEAEWEYTPWDDSNPPTGVPNNSVDVADYKAYLGSI